MDFHMKLPRNKKEFILFMAVISLISVNIIAPLITCFELGFRFEVWLSALKVIPFIWPCVIALVLITYKPAEKMTYLIIKKEDSFGAHMTVNILCTVFLMSIFLTVIGTWIGSRHISLEPVRLFFYKWPRNFAISFAVEAVIAQPIARLVMNKLHKVKDKHKES
jgi:accessory gene regulator protein AgrB